MTMTDSIRDALRAAYLDGANANRPSYAFEPVEAATAYAASVYLPFQPIAPPSDYAELSDQALRHIADSDPGAQSAQSLAHDMALVAKQALAAIRQHDAT